MASKGQCLQCTKDIGSRQQALQCGSCSKWQHRTCNTGVSQDSYRQALREGTCVPWTCANCNVTQASSLLEGLAIQPVTKQAKKRIAKFRNLALSQKVTAQPAPQPTATAQPAKTINKRVAKRIGKSAASTIPPSGNACALDLPLDPLDKLDLPRVSMPHQVVEDAVSHPVINPATEIIPEPDYQVIAASSQRGRPKLIDNLGFTYVQSRVGKTVTSWRCSVRSTYGACSATVRQTGDSFSRGPQPHNHAGQPGAAATTRIQVAVKEQATKAIFEPALSIVESAILKETEEHGVGPNLPKPTNLTRLANYNREKLRPDEPVDLEFDYNGDYVPDFLVGDITVNGKRHLMFATTQQLDYLSWAKTWYLDGTFKVVRQPFYQLWSIHAFVTSGDDTKQMPFLFVLMSSRRTVDYKGIFDHLRTLIDCNVQEMVLDFELSLWKAINETMPDVNIRGCCFHWTQSVWRRIQSVGLQSNYMQDAAVHMLCKQLLALPFIPAEHIRPVFEKLQERAVTPDLQELTDYISMTWMESTVWTPEAWSVFGQSVRTNNDVEGWHHRLNAKAKKGNLPFYMLLHLLHEEAKIININMHLITEHRLKRHQRSKYRQLQADIFEAWDDYAAGKLSVTGLLDKCGKMYQPTE